jgi:hypothetical protein
VSSRSKATADAQHRAVIDTLRATWRTEGIDA